MIVGVGIDLVEIGGMETILKNGGEVPPTDLFRGGDPVL